MFLRVHYELKAQERVILSLTEESTHWEFFYSGSNNFIKKY